ncbi:hypothetical protein [Polaromonas sp.]|uniref:hypothetical protein n=1 Tax=Polaromonas sp. TaxID=1869339 RepID=UPI003BB6F6F7
MCDPVVSVVKGVADRAGMRTARTGPAKTRNADFTVRHEALALAHTNSPGRPAGRRAIRWWPVRLKSHPGINLMLFRFILMELMIWLFLIAFLASNQKFIKNKFAMFETTRHNSA